MEGMVISVSPTKMQHVEGQASLLTIDIPDGPVELEYPSSFSPPEISALVGHRIHYTDQYEYWFGDSPIDSSISNKYTLKALEGPHAGWQIEKTVFE